MTGDNRERQIDQRDQQFAYRENRTSRWPTRPPREHSVQRHDDRRGHEREPNRGERIGRMQRTQVHVEAARTGGAEHRRHRHDEYHGQKREARCRSTALVATLAVRAIPAGIAAGHQRRPAARRMRQPLIALIVSSITNDTHSITKT